MTVKKLLESLAALFLLTLDSDEVELDCDNAIVRKRNLIAWLIDADEY